MYHVRSISLQLKCFESWTEVGIQISCGWWLKAYFSLLCRDQWFVDMYWFLIASDHLTIMPGKVTVTVFLSLWPRQHGKVWNVIRSTSPYFLETWLLCWHVLISDSFWSFDHVRGRWRYSWASDPGSMERCETLSDQVLTLFVETWVLCSHVLICDSFSCYMPFMLLWL